MWMNRPGPSRFSFIPCIHSFSKFYCLCSQNRSWIQWLHQYSSNLRHNSLSSGLLPQSLKWSLPNSCSCTDHLWLSRVAILQILQSFFIKLKSKIQTSWSGHQTHLTWLLTLASLWGKHMQTKCINTRKPPHQQQSPASQRTRKPQSKACGTVPP